jgi:F0F1-type ATP synthase assembly protein I
VAKGDDDDRSALTYGLYPAVGLLLGMAVGYWLDQKYGWGSKGLLIGGVLGLVSGMYLLIKEGMKISKD